MTISVKAAERRSSRRSTLIPAGVRRAMHGRLSFGTYPTRMEAELAQYSTRPDFTELRAILNRHDEADAADVEQIVERRYVA